MFDIGFSEMLLLAAIALIAIGPKQLPDVARAIGRFLNQLKDATGDFQKTLRDSGASAIDPGRKALEVIDEKLRTELQSAMQKTTEVADQIHRQVNGTGSVSPAANVPENSPSQAAQNNEKSEPKT